MMLAEKSFSSSQVEDEVSASGAKPINLAEPTIQQPTTQAARSTQRGIIIREPLPQEQSTQELVPKEKEKKKLKKAPTAPSRDSTSSPLRRARGKA